MPRPKKDQSITYKFKGFERPEANYFKMPNSWTNITALIDNLAELKVVEYVLRHTWGFQEFGVKKHITLPEFVSGRRRQDGTNLDAGTGLSKRAVQDGLNKAVEHGFIEEAIDDSDRARIKKYYSLCMDASIQEDSTEGITGSEENYSDWQSLPVGWQGLPVKVAKFASRSEKDTLETHPVERNLINSNSLELDTQVFKSETRSKFSKQRDKNDKNGTGHIAEPQPQPKRTGGVKSIGELLESHQPLKPAATATQQPSERRKRGRPAKYPATPAIEALMTQWTDELHDDPDHARPNISQAARLWHESGVSEDTFRSLLYEARTRTKQAGNVEKLADGEAGEMGFRNRVPYFFACLKQLIKEDLKRQVNDRAPSTGKGKSSSRKVARTTDVAMGTFRPS